MKIKTDCVECEKEMTVETTDLKPGDVSQDGSTMCDDCKKRDKMNCKKCGHHEEDHADNECSNDGFCVANDSCNCMGFKQQ